ncbi:MAG: hypothetical protein IJ752_02040 [Alphaproteobacteria bacterium]|nr:hypothetical protein [Alphaproteobacteria bacterium]
MTEENQRDLMESVQDFLMKKGYPEESILVDYKIGKYRPDLTIVDPNTNTPLQIFELKTKRTPQTEEAGKQQLRRYTAEAEKVNPDIVGYLVFPKETEPFFEAIDVRKNQLVRNSVFDYKNLVQKGKNAKETLLDSRKKTAVGNLKFATIGLNIFILIFFVLDVFDVVELSGQRLYLLLISILLVLLPYYETIKIANFELTQREKKDK